MDQKKDFWDVLNVVTTLIIAGMVGYWGYTNEKTKEANQAAYDKVILSIEKQRLQLDKLAQEYENTRSELELELRKQDQETHKLAVMETFIPHIIKSKESRKVALIALSNLKHNDIALEFSRVYNDSLSKEAGDEILNFGTSDEQADYPDPPQIISSTDGQVLKEGWMYLGRREENRWKGNYTDLDHTKSLEELVGLTVSVKSGVPGVNIRTGYPSLFGKLKPVIDTLKPGSSLIIGDKTHSTFNDFIWVNVKYSTPER